ncbi:NYN domain-containing protein [Oscillatoria sp. FACHB-1407]|uniref:NYN domain-containing protein n=1 Tax=Oscillatoria sp. FACHB-1407 TaxID=2692847 RepID=UPI0016883D47|nr:NYN domain-containing protein [Oscillatoria sp. FACHB-1407]MBD2463321.1 NYN domain-containing protein [Oscillatoria sp. FACHB-1407]
MSRSTPQGILLVDGYNMIGAWPNLRETRDRDGLEAARRDLIEALLSYSAYQDFETEVVFDAQYQGTPGTREVINRHFAIFYTDYKQTADSYIELACSRFRNDVRKFKQRLIVATSDEAQRLTVVGYGAECMSAQKLWAEVEGATHRVRKTQRSKGRSPQRFLSSSLDPIAQQRLAQLRLGLDGEKK